MIKTVTIKENEKYLITDKIKGTSEFIDGPKFKILFNKDFKKVDFYKIDEKEYAILTLYNGQKEYIVGPATLFFNEIKYSEIKIENKIIVGNNEATVVINGSGKKIINGPAFYELRNDERLHKFSWHGHNRDYDDRYLKSPNRLQFSHIRLIPDQMYYDVCFCRTKDNLLLDLRYMIYYSIDNLELLLEKSHDPVADIINMLSSIVNEIIGGVNFDEFKEDQTILNDFSRYNELVDKLKLCGIEISKVIYIGYFTDKEIEKMHVNAIKEQTKYKLTKEVRIEEKKLEKYETEETYKLKEYSAEKELKCTEFEIERINKTRENDFIQTTKLNNQEIEFSKQKKEIEENNCKKLKDLGVNLTQYLIAPYYVKPDKLIMTNNNGIKLTADIDNI